MKNDCLHSVQLQGPIEVQGKQYFRIVNSWGNDETICLIPAPDELADEPIIVEVKDEEQTKP